jgi:hypothetical protein
MTRIEQIQNLSESKVSIKIEANSRGFNTSVHCYAGVTKKEIDDTIAKTIYAHTTLQKALTPEKEKEQVIPELA